MSIRYTDNTPRVKLEFGQRTSLFIRFMMDEILRASTPITPKKHGNLSRDVLKRVIGDKGQMEWRKVYASVQERGSIKGSPIRNYTTPGTGPKYAERGVKTGVGLTSKVAKKARLM